MAPERVDVTDLISVVQTLSKFTILFWGPMIWNSLPTSITCWASFVTFKKKMLEFLFKQSRICYAALTQHQNILLYYPSRWPLLWALWFPGLLATNLGIYIKSKYYVTGK